ncbi:MAG TPA: SAM-dependent methyltransferase [Mycobacteriales bacterium]|nr:SAM-dependent methyltransferase [Mycobacteriales bacterium]
MRPWREAWTAALYGPGGFYARGEAPAAHFRTSVHASRLYAAAIGELLRRVDRVLGSPDPLDLVDVGAGRGELLAGVLAAAEPGLRNRIRPVAVEAGPLELPGVRVLCDVADLPGVTGLLLANEWLDDVPLDVVELTADGPRTVLVSPAGAEALGGPPAAADAAWLARWWPHGAVGDRAEVGRTRDEAWTRALGRLDRGVAVAVDYAHEAGARPRAGTLTGYRGGRQVRPVPDGSCDLTAHVALDAAAAAGRAAGAAGTWLGTQRAALSALPIDARRPPLDLARTDPAAYLRALRRAGEAGELTDPAGLGGFGWLVQAVHASLPLEPDRR